MKAHFRATLMLLLLAGCKPSASLEGSGTSALAPQRAQAQSSRSTSLTVEQSACADAHEPVARSFANPLNLSYRFQLSTPSRREAADPTVVRYRDRYYLFASRSGGYYTSTNLLDWGLVTSNDLPLEDYAPTAVVIDDWLYFMASSPSPTIYRTQEPEQGTWQPFNDAFPLDVTDPALFVDDDGRVYLYYGCSNVEPLHAVELDPQKRLEPIGKPVDVIEANPKEHGWERPGDRNELDTAPWLEGAWMNKVQDKYYLQYAAPGTEYKSYADGVYVSDRPLGPFSYAPNSPFSRKPAGFIAGAGHGSTFADEYGNHWHIATMSISVAHKFERRLGLFPTLFSENGVHTVTEFGDFPMRMPTMKFSQPDEVATGWMLLSHAKSATASSSFVGTSVTNAVDEDVRTHWAAKSGGAGEWISVDLGRAYCVRALQINLGEQDSTILGPNAQASQYVVESSLDARSWTLLLDRGDATVDLPHFYQQLETPVRARFVRVTNKRVPSGKFTVSGLRVFGNGQGARPARVQNLSLVRSESDRRTATLSWDSVAGVTGYNVRFGNTEHALFQSHTVFGRNALELNSLDAGTSYWFAVDAFNENGVTRATQLTKVE